MTLLANKFPSGIIRIDYNLPLDGVNLLQAETGPITYEIKRISDGLVLDTGLIPVTTTDGIFSVDVSGITEPVENLLATSALTTSIGVIVLPVCEIQAVKLVEELVRDFTEIRILNPQQDVRIVSVSQSFEVAEGYEVIEQVCVPEVITLGSRIEVITIGNN